MSSGCPTRPRATFLPTYDMSTFWPPAAVETIWVSIAPGWTELTRMCFLPSSIAATLVIPRIANLLAV